jgi:hypothetical protein
MKARREQGGTILWQVEIRNGQAYRVFRDDRWSSRRLTSSGLLRSREGFEKQG